MKISKRTAITVVLIAVFIAAAIAYSYMNKPHRDQLSEDAIATSPEALYNSMYLRSESDLLDKTIRLSGKITDMQPGEEPVCVLEIPGISDATVRASFRKDKASSLSNLRVGDIIQIRGICSGVLADTLMEGLTSVDILIRDASLAGSDHH